MYSGKKPFSAFVLHPNRTTHHLATTHPGSTAAAATCACLCPRTTSIISRPHVLVGLKENQINFRREQTRQHYGCAYAQAHTQTGRLDLIVVARAEINCNRCEENNAGRVHSKSNIFCFVEVFRNLSRFESVNRAKGDEKYD